MGSKGSVGVTSEHPVQTSRETGALTLLTELQRDIRRYGSQDQPIGLVLLRGLFSHPSLAGVLYYRIGRLLLMAPMPGKALLWLVYRALYPLVRMYSGVELSPRARLGPGLCIMHFGPTIIHPDVTAGENLTLMHGVTIGGDRRGIPSLGDNVSVGTGATIIGKIWVGDGVTIGAGAVVTASIPAHTTVVGIPARAVEDGLKDTVAGS